MKKEVEIWRPIIGAENYEVSNLGRYKKGKRILKPHKDTNGYLQAIVYINGKYKYFQIHRLQAIAFELPNPNNYPEINHKDECKTNNVIYFNSDMTIDEERTNLEWCTRSYNVNYGTRNKRVAKAKSKKVLCVETNQIYDSTIDIQRKLGFYHGVIVECCNNSRCHKTAYGYHWQYV